MALSGQWLAAKKVKDPQYAVLHQAAPEHFEAGAFPEKAPVWAAPSYYEVAPQNPAASQWVANSPGVLAVEPGGHDQAPGHTYDDGGLPGDSVEQQFNQFTSEKYNADVWVGLESEASAIDPVVRARGMNAEPENNPSDSAYGGYGWRRGVYRYSRVDRDFSPPNRVHDARTVNAQQITTIGDAAPAGGPYNSPFSSLARVRRNRFNKPQMRRIPQSWDDAVITDGSEALAAGPPPLIGGQWVAG